MKRVKRSMLVCMLAIVLTTLLTAGVVQAAGLSGATWRVVKSPNPGSRFNVLQGVAVVSATNIWAVGYSVNSRFAPAQTLIEHWNGSNWQVVPSPNVGSSDNTLSGVAAVSANDIWAVGSLIEHWNGSSWQVVPSPTVGSFDTGLQGVAVVSATDIWAVGSYYNSSGVTQTLIEHWNGSSWQVIASPNPGSAGNGFGSVAVVSATDIWAVGYFANSGGPAQTLVEHWNGSSWQVVSSPSVAGALENVLRGVAVVSVSNIWAVGSYDNSNYRIQTLVEHWNGSSWQIVPSPTPRSNNSLHGLTVVSASNIWAVGNSCCNSSSVDRTLVEHWNGSSWQVVSSPNVAGSGSNDLDGVARVPGGTTLWAVGDYASTTSLRSSLKTLTEFYS